MCSRARGLLAAALLVALAPGIADAQPTRGRLLRGLELRSLPDGSDEIRIRMGVPVRYLRHAPRSPSDRIEIEITPLGQDLGDLLAQAGDEAVRAPADTASSLQEVRYRGGRRRSGRLELLFARPVRLEVQEGSDLRSLLVVVSPASTRAQPIPDSKAAEVDEDPSHDAAPSEATRPATEVAPSAPSSAHVNTAHPFALQLFAAPSNEALPQVDPAGLEPGLRVYRVPFFQEGVPWHRLRMGFFATEDDARAAQEGLAPDFPTAWVVRVAVAERLDSASFEVTPKSVRANAALRNPQDEAPEQQPTETASSQDEAPEQQPTETASSQDETASSQDEAPEQQPTETASSQDEQVAQEPIEQVGELSPADTEQVAKVLAEGRSALAAGQLDRAVALFTKVLSFPENPSTPSALEWLGLARERNGQLAHARAEYENYLERYSEGEAAERVRQRLDALVTARAEPPPALRPASTKDRASDFDVFGSIATSYRRDERFTDDFGDSLVNSSIFSDLFLGSRWQSERWDVRGELSGTHLFDFIDNDERWRVNTLFVDAEGLGVPWNVGFGRLPGNRAGVVGRFDGAEVSYELGPGLRLGTVAGFPVDPFVRSSPDLSQQLLGLNLETLGVVEGLDVEFFAVQQWAEGFTDRSAIGAEFRYAADGRFLAGLLDYDVHFNDLNTAFLVGNLRLRPDTDLNLLVDWRRLPSLGTRNALFGQQDDSLSDLHDRFGTDEIEDLADDRTARSRSVSVGLTHRLNERFQISGDVGISDLSGTPASGGIEEFEGTGRQISTYLQATGSEFFVAGDIATLGLRWVEAQTIEILGLHWSWRSPMWRRFRLNPLVDLEWRDAQDREGVFTLRPGFRVDFRVGRITLDMEGHYRWSKGERFPGVGDEQGYSVLLGARYDY
ncbi:MAG: SPOR domain-containing protein [Deltaproteobacteria bacterium]|nr:SPOR domain-containing protein [Deltaproteobacteria bacterium]